MADIRLTKQQSCGLLLGSFLMFLSTGCVMNTNVAVTKDSVVVQNNVTISDRLLKLLVWF